jgi:hypothetical protein
MIHNSDNQEEKKEAVSKKPASFLMKCLLAIVGAIIVPAITAYVTTLITIHLETQHERPDIKIIGAMPIHLYGSLLGPDETKFRTHRLAFIFKLQNSSPTSTILHMAMFEGCTPIPPIVAESHISKDKRTISGTNINVLYEKHKNTIQRIGGSAVVRQDSQVIPGYGISYVGAIFLLPGQSAFHTVQGSVSLNGDCKEILLSNPHPAISQVFDIERIHKEIPKDINPSFRYGRLKLSLFIGSDRIVVKPDRIKPLRSLRMERWEELAIAQMYENPDTSYPPTKSE